MKRFALLVFIIILILMLPACSSQECTCTCCTTQAGCNTVSKTSETNVQQESKSINEEIKFEDSCENPIGDSHYPYVTQYSSNSGDVGSVSIATAEHGNCFDGAFNRFGMYLGTGILPVKECYSTEEEATKHPIQIDSRGHEIIVTMSYDQNTESFTLNAGDSQLLSIKELSYLTTRAYVYVVVT